jgi:fatty-acid peroxygenase
MSPELVAAALIRHVPAVPGWDHSLQFLADPYRFISRQCRRLGSDVVQARLVLQPTLCLSGPRAARLFHDETRFCRGGAAPGPVRAPRSATGPVQNPDGAAHRARKQFFLSVCGPGRTAALLDQAQHQWDALLPGWQAGGSISLYTASHAWLARTVCRWAGVPLPECDAAQRTAQLAALFDGAASGIGTHLHAQRARWGAQAWLAGLVRAHRAGADVFPPDSPAAAAAALRDADGTLLAPRLAAAELLDVLQPVEAVPVFVVFAAHALHLHPGWAETLRGGRAGDLQAFVQEVRRFYPIFPAVAAKVRREFVWEGWHFRPGTRAMLDVYGTNHDARAWPEPDAFRPERFFGAIPGLFGFVPHGGGRAEDHDRCPAEGIAVALMKLALRQLTGRVRYRVPPQDLRIRMDRLPALPVDRLRIDQLRPA